MRSLTRIITAEFGNHASLANGFSHLRPGNLEKSPSVEQHVRPCSMASAARWASGTRRLVIHGSWRNDAKIFWCPSPGTGIHADSHGVIAGRIVDAGGEPRWRITVAALRPAPSGDGRPPGAGRTMQMSQTNDQGDFGLASLPDGQYVVIAAALPRRPFATSQPAGGTVLAPTHYPARRPMRRLSRSTSGLRR
jgi:hypothetical protein